MLRKAFSKLYGGWAAKPIQARSVRLRSSFPPPLKPPPPIATKPRVEAKRAPFMTIPTPLFTLGVEPNISSFGNEFLYTPQRRITKSEYGYEVLPRMSHQLEYIRIRVSPIYVRWAPLAIVIRPLDGLLCAIVVAFTRGNYLLAVFGILFSILYVLASMYLIVVGLYDCFPIIDYVSYRPLSCGSLRPLLNMVEGKR